MALPPLANRLPALAFAALLLIACGTASPATEVEVIEVEGILDAARLRYLRESIETAATNRSLAIVSINSGATVAPPADLAETAALVADPPLPLVVWLGPAPARAGGGAAQLLAQAPLRAAAPGAVIAHWDPAVVGSTANITPLPEGMPPSLQVIEPVPGLIDLVSPSIRQLLQDLRGRSVTVGGTEVVLDPIVDVEGGVTTAPVAFRQPGLWHRFFHLGVQPDAAFFFLVAGLTVAVFEFYALGPGIAAGVAALSLLLAGYGLSVLPTRPWALVSVAVGVAFLTAAFQRGGVLFFTLVGTGFLTLAGLNLMDGAPQIQTSPLGVVASVLAVLFFYLLALPTVARSRFSTPTLGRDHLIGRRGRATVDLGPDGEVEVDGGRWPATGHRQAQIARGDPVKVVAVNGWELEVEPDREN
jgi:membrane-bound serine protease (ClpP class)